LHSELSPPKRDVSGHYVELAINTLAADATPGVLWTGMSDALQKCKVLSSKIQPLLMFRKINQGRKMLKKASYYLAFRNFQHTRKFTIAYYSPKLQVSLK